MEVIVLLIVLVVGGLYFIPTIVALMREHPSKGWDHHPEHISGLDARSDGS